MDENDRGDERVGRAIRMVAKQADCTFDEAYELIRASADATDETIGDVADLVLDGHVRFDT